MKIKYVQLESDAFLTDIDFIQMSPSERGVYCSLILYLTSNDGKCESDLQTLRRLCNCDSDEEFKRIWNKVAKKFQTRKGVIRHKRVTEELTRSRKLLQAKRTGGLRSAERRKHSCNTTTNTVGNTVATKGRKGNVIEKEREYISNTNTTEQSLSSSTSVRSRPTAEGQHLALSFNEALVGIIRPRSQSDRTCFNNVTRWLVEGCTAGKFNEGMFNRVLDYAREASRGRNPPAVFMSLLKKELGYRNV